jgi:hypothetical protein
MKACPCPIPLPPFLPFPATYQTSADVLPCPLTLLRPLWRRLLIGILWGAGSLLVLAVIVIVPYGEQGVARHMHCMWARLSSSPPSGPLPHTTRPSSGHHSTNFFPTHPPSQPHPSMQWWLDTRPTLCTRRARGCSQSIFWTTPSPPAWASLPGSTPLAPSPPPSSAMACPSWDTT